MLADMENEKNIFQWHCWIRTSIDANISYFSRQFIDYDTYGRTNVHYEASIYSITFVLILHVERHVGKNAQDMPYIYSGGGVVGEQIQYNQRINGREHTMEKSSTEYYTVIQCLIIVIGVVV